MSARFTPGPWSYSFEVNNVGFEGDTFMAGPLHCDGTACFSSVVEGGLVLADDKENEANARLIAAAPELYKYLSLALGVINAAKIMWPGYDAASDALAKARGEA